MVLQSKYKTTRNIHQNSSQNHSNASLERLLSIIQKNKTDMQSSLKFNGTLSSILSIKTDNPESRTLCFKWRPDQDLLELSHKAAKAYNDEHKS